MNAASRALCAALSLLPDGIRFNIVSFGSTYRTLFLKSEGLVPETRIAALAHASSLQADMGGTDILSPLQYILEQEAPAHYARQVFVLTDGRVKNIQDLLKYARKKAKATRVFTFGIGQAADRALCDGLAVAGGGKAAYVNDVGRSMGGGTEGGEEALVLAVSGMVSAALTPALTSLRLFWDGLPVTSTQPHNLPNLYSGSSYTVYGTIPDLPPAQLQALLSRYLSQSKQVSDGSGTHLPVVQLRGMYVNVCYMLCYVLYICVYVLSVYMCVMYVCMCVMYVGALPDGTAVAIPLQVDLSKVVAGATVHRCVYACMRVCVPVLPVCCLCGVCAACAACMLVCLCVGAFHFHMLSSTGSYGGGYN